MTQSGYIKSHFLDDKLSVGILLGYAKYLKDEQITPERAVYVHITSFEEVGHGGSASVPAGVTEAISVDMGCVGEGLTCDERMVSICAKDSGGPYHYDVVRGISRNCPNAEDALDVLGKLGGLDIAGLCGVFLGGARYRVPIVMDGFISGVAALCAVRLCPRAEAAIFASHASSEPAARRVMEALGKRPLITAGMHLGEGTGAVASIPLWDMALAVYQGCYSFAEGGIAPYTPQC